MPEATGTFYPVTMIPANMRFLENFHWFDYVRPLNPKDIFVWRGKTKGTELKATTKRHAPLQNLKEIGKNHGNVQNTRAKAIPSR